MKRSRITVLIWALLTACVCASCSSGGILVTQKPFSGKLVAAGAEVGEISFTITNGQLAGSANVIHNGQVVILAVFGTVNNGFFQGAIEATGLGSGVIDGNVSDSGNSFAGDFEYSDLAGISNTIGTWSADSRSQALN